MEIIVTHDMADFDALAATVAAQKLHPGAAIVLTERLGREVREYLTLHKDRFRTLSHADIDPSRVSRLVVVDVRRKSRLIDYAELLAKAERGELFVVVYDHHPAADDDLDADEETVERVGSATTLLVERMRERGLDVDPVEATLFALGIHADTGSLTYAATTARDARALAWLLESGASLPVLARYLDPPFSPEQRALLATLLGKVEVERFGHLDVAFVEHALDHAVDGFGEVASELSELGDHAALFCVLSLEKRRVQVVARSRSPLIDVGKIVTRVGGGGHEAAASATLRRAEPAEVTAEIRRALAEAPPLARKVADLMSSPVHTVTPSTPLSEVSASLSSWRHSGVPVVSHGELVGIVSHRDVEEASREGHLGRNVGSSMSQPVHSIDASATPEDALELMEAKDVGRLPVLRGGKLVGIVSRSDLLRVLYRVHSRS